MKTTRFDSLPLSTANVLDTWIEQNNLSESTHVIQGVTHDDYLITLNGKPAVSGLTIDGQNLDLTDYVILEHVYDGEGFFGQRFAYRLTLTDDSQLAEDFLRRWEDNL